MPRKSHHPQVPAPPRTDSFFEFSPEPSCILDADFRFLGVNAAWQKAVGFVAEAVLGRGLPELLHEDDRERAQAVCARVMQGGGPVEFELRFARPDGSYQRLSWKAAYSPREKLIFATLREAGAFAKKALRRQAETRLRGRRHGAPRAAPEREGRALRHELQVHQIELEMQNEELIRARQEAEAHMAEYADLYEFAPTGYATLRRDGVIRRINLTGADLLGQERSRLVGSALRSWLAAASLPAFERFLGAIFASRSPQRCEVELPAQVPGEPRLLRLSAMPPRRPEEFRVSIEDFTERKRLERELEKAAKLRSDLISLINHEYANVLTNQRLALALLESSEGPSPNETRVHAYEVLARSVAKLKAYTTNFLDLHRLESGEFKLNLRPIALRSLTEDCLSMLRPMAEAKRQRLSFTCDLPDEESAAVRADADCVAVIINNLVNNAIKYTPEAGSISVRVCLEKDGRVAVSVQDSGIGISAADVEKIRTGYYRTQRSKELAQGFGVGLVVVHRLLEKHGSRLEIESCPGQGSVFSFRLPLWQEPSAF